MEELKVMLNTEKSLTKMHEHGYVKDRLWSEMMELNLIEIKKPLQKSTHRHRKAILKKRGEQNDLRILRGVKSSPSAPRQGHSPSDCKKNLNSMASKSSEEHLLCGHGASSANSPSCFHFFPCPDFGAIGGFLAHEMIS